MNTATVKVYTGAEWRNVTGKIVNTGPNGATVEDERGVRWYATNDRLTLYELERGQDLDQSPLW